jgi:DNA-directed RNA polymerase sigma subunit (sigma70/sigma32)
MLRKYKPRINAEVKDVIENNLDCLSNKFSVRLRERNISLIRMRLGIGTDKPCSLRETAKKFGVNPERVRQLVVNAYRYCLVGLHNET